jgi:hypothetical protein
LEGSPPAWVSWTSAHPYLSEGFFNPQSSSSLPAFRRWIDTDPITADTGFLASYKQVELVALGCGLAFRALWIAQFPDRYSDVPAHIINSPYPFSEYEQLSHCIDDLLCGYAETYVALLLLTILQLSNCVHRIEQIEAYYAHKTQSSKQDTSKESGGDTENAGELETAIEEDEATVGANTAPDGNDAAGENGGNSAPSKKGQNASDGLGNRR